MPATPHDANVDNTDLVEQQIQRRSDPEAKTPAVLRQLAEQLDVPLGTPPRSDATPPEPEG